MQSNRISNSARFYFIPVFILMIFLLSCDSKNIDDLLSSASIKLQTGNYKECIIECNKIIELDPQRTIAYRLRGLSNKSLNHYDDAYTDYDKAIELDPSNSLYYYERGQVSYLADYKDSAKRDWLKAAKLGSVYAKRDLKTFYGIFAD